MTVTLNLLIEVKKILSDNLCSISLKFVRLQPVLVMLLTSHQVNSTNLKLANVKTYKNLAKKD